MGHTYRASIAAGIIGVLVVSASFMLGKASAQHFTCTDDFFTCVEEYYRSVIERDGAIAALRDLKMRFAEGGPARTFCHPLLHMIGEAAGKEFGEVGKAYRFGETFCRSGYYHGVLEGIFAKDGERLLASMDSICTTVRGAQSYSYDYFSCVHGIGHGLMSYFDHNLFASLKGCDRLTGEWEQVSCHGGVFMENIISHTAEIPSKFLRDDDPLYPCNAVEDKYRGQCYLMQTSHMLTLARGDFEKVFDACASVEPKFRVPCYQSLGRDASGWSSGEADAVLALCSYGATSEARTHCVTGAAVDYIQSVSSGAAISLCGRAVEDARSECLQAVEEQLIML